MRPRALPAFFPLLSLFAFLVACPSSDNPPASTPGTGGGSGGRGGSGSGGTGGTAGTAGTGGTGGNRADARTPDGRTPDRPGGDRPRVGDAPGGGTTYVFTASNASYGAATSTITALTLDLATGALTKGPTVSGRQRVSYGAFSPDKKFLFAATEETAAHLTSYSINAATGALTMVNDVLTGGSNAESVAIHPGGAWAAVAHYTDGRLTLLPIAPTGTLMTASDTEMAGGAGANPNCHQALFDRAGTSAFVPCPTPRYIAQYRFANGALTANATATVAVTGQPRHLAFSPDELFAYAVTEAEATVASFGYDKTTGRLTAVGTPKQAFSSEAGGGSHIVVHPSGRFLFAGSRFDNRIAVFAIAANGEINKTSDGTDADLSYPRDFDLDPSGTFLIAGTQPNISATMPANLKPAGGGKVVVFRIDQSTGALTRVGTPAALEVGTGTVWWVGSVSLP